MKPFEIFRVGKHTASNGLTKDFTDDDVQKIADSYDPQNNEAPIVIGHPKTNGPAWGWIDAVKKVGDRLFAYPKQVVTEFEDMVKKGLFKKRSISLYPDGTLRHVGFLGATPPAVKGLKDVEFQEEDDAAVFEFAEQEPQADAAVYQAQIDKLNSQITELTTKLSDFAQSDQARVDAEKRLDAINLRVRQMDFERYLNEKIVYGTVTPAQEKKIMKLLEVLDSVQFASGNDQPGQFEFADGEKLEPVAVLKELIDTLPKQVEFAELGKKDIQPEADLSDPGKVAAKALEFYEKEKKEGRMVSFTDAVAHVISV